MIQCDWAVHVTIVVLNQEVSFNLYANDAVRARALCECLRIAARSGVDFPLRNSRAFVRSVSEPYQL